MKIKNWNLLSWLVGLLVMALLAIAPVRATEVLTYIHNDVAGNPVAATDQNGVVRWRESYRPYGERTVNAPAAAGNRQFFHGKAIDPDTGLSYFGARYYDPVVGRFMGVDPRHFDENNLHSFNRYAYANNNPYRFVDPDGRSPFDVGLLLYDLGSLAHALYQGNGVGEAAIGVGLSVVGVISPVPGTGVALKAARAAEHAVEAGRAANELGHVVQEVGFAAKGGLTEARAARDALSAELAPLKGKAPATVTGGYNVKTGEVAARACGGGKCAESHVVDALGGAKGDVRFTEAVRPRTGAEVPVCPRCEATFGRESFPRNTRFKSDE